MSTNTLLRFSTYATMFWLFWAGTGRALATPPPLEINLRSPAQVTTGEREPLPLTDVAPAFHTWLTGHPPPAEHPEASYHFQAEILQAVAGVMAGYPDRVRVVEVGRSLQNLPIWGFVLSNPATPIRQRMLVMASIHALEWIPSEAALAMLEWFAAYPQPGVELTVVPVLNVDGRQRVEDDLLAGLNIYRRGNAAGVDLNRDFEVNHEATSFWRHIFPGFHSASAAPLSQPESQAIDRLASLGRYDLAISLHAFGGYIYYPWSGRWQHPADYHRLAELAARMSLAQSGWAYRPQQLSRWGFFFRAQGSELDHLYGKFGTPTFLVECTHSGIDPLRPRTWRTYFRWYNPRDPTRHVHQVLQLLQAGARLLTASAPGALDQPPPRD